VHLTSCVAGEAHVGHRDFCDVCLPLGSMSKAEQEAALRRLMGVPHDVPLVEPGGSPDTR
jgi:hypothetical protein